MCTVLLMGPEDDVSVRRIKNVLENVYHARTYTWDPSQISSRNPATFFVQENEIVFPCTTGPVQSQKIDVAFWRSIALSELPESCSQHANQETWSNNHANALLTLLRADPFPWVNSHTAYVSHRTKPLQLQLVHHLGVRIPETIVSNSLQDAREFLDTYKAVVIKPIWSGDYAQVLGHTAEDLATLEQALYCSPHTIQRCIQGTNIRTYVIGDQTFSVRIEAETTDFRLDPEHELGVWELPREQVQQALQLTGALHMDWTAIDWRLGEDAQYYFLEANFSPMFAAVEAKTGLPLTRALCRLLLARAERRTSM